MSFPYPDIILPSVYDISPELLRERGISLLLMDLDNTLAPYSEDEPREELRRWVQLMREGGIKLFILSNNRGERPKRFGEALGLANVNHSRKPKTDMLFRVLAEYDVAPKNAAIVGDQIFTDVLCGVRAGVTSIVVKPIKFTNPFLFLRYIAELPFRRTRQK